MTLDCSEIFRTISPYISLSLFILSTILAVIERIKNGSAKKDGSLYERMIQDMINAENMYNPIKEKGIDVSQMKKQFVLSDLQIFANSNGIKFNIDLWTNEIEHMIEFSKKINAIEKVENCEEQSVKAWKGLI